MKRLAIVLSLFVGACSSRTPPVVVPTPPPSNTRHDSLLLARQGPTLIDAEGKPFAFRGHASCCFSEEGEPSADWALASKAHLDHLKAQGYNVTHWRLGPYRALHDSPESLKATGGAYAEVNGKADLTRWNPAFWGYVREHLDYAGQLGIRVEIDIEDGWGCKPGGGADRVEGYHPWRASNNIQGQEFAATCATGELVKGSVEEAWVRKVFEETVEFSNVIYQDGNEINLVRGYSPTWTASVGNHLRDVERIKKAKTHLYGTNAPGSVTLPQVDYLSIHDDRAPTEADRRGTDKPVLNNEYNPDPPFSGERIKALVCEAKRNGTYVWHWRHSQSKAQAEETARLLSLPCEDLAVPERAFPQGIPDEDFTRISSKPTLHKVVNDVALQVAGCTGYPCLHRRNPHDFMEAVTAELRKRGYWAGQHVLRKTDEIAVGTSCQGEWEGMHITSHAVGNEAVVKIGLPSQPCAGDRAHGDPAGVGCTGTPGALGYRGNWKIKPHHCQ